MSTLSRRQLIRALGLTGAATFLPWLRPRLANAAPAPVRLLLYWSGSGVPRHAYNLTSASGGAPTETDFVFPAVRAPLNAIKNQLITFHNLAMVSDTVDPTPPANAHYQGETHSLAATSRANADTPGGPSLDQYIAKAINAARPLTKVPSLTLAAQNDGNVSGLKVCTAARGEVVSFEPSASAVYRRLFDNFSAPVPATQAGPSAQAIAAAQRKSVLDHVLREFAALKPGLSAAAVQKLEAHADSVRDFENRLALTSSGPSASGSALTACRDPGSASLNGAKNVWPGDSAMLKLNFDAMTSLVQAAFACDLTRVALLAPAEPFGDSWGYTKGAWGTTDEHDLLHRTAMNGNLRTDTAPMDAVHKLHQLECRQFMQMLDLLRGIPEADGTMLDYTIVLWCSQIGEQSHALDQLPWIMAGGSKVGFRPGRYLNLARGSSDKGTPHNNLFVSIAQAMGVQTNTFGNPAVCTGPLAGLRG
jgi:Protein of unknown function (DUF1552)